MVATVLLIMAAIIAGALVTSFSQKSGKKVSDKIVEIGTSVECNDIRLSVIEIGGELIIKNRGTLGVDKVVLRKFSGENVVTEEIDEFGEDAKLLPGSEYNSGSIDATRVEAKPVFRSDEGDLIGCNAVTYEA